MTQLFGRQRGGEQAGLVVVEVEHHRFRLQREIAEQVAQLVEALVIEGDVVEHRDLRPVERDRAVAFVDLADEDVAAADQRAGERRIGAERNSSSPRRSSPSGRGPVAWRIQPIMPVTVDLPLVPPTAMPIGAALNSSASSSARLIRSRPSAFAFTMSGT